MRRHIALLAAVIPASSLGAQEEQTVRWPVGSRVRVWTNTARNVTFGGAAAGVFTTFVFADALWGELCPSDCGDPSPSYPRAALIGAGLGALIGAARRADQWREVPVPARLMVAPSSRRTTVGISFAFR